MSQFKSWILSGFWWKRYIGKSNSFCYLSHIQLSREVSTLCKRWIQGIRWTWHFFGPVTYFFALLQWSHLSGNRRRSWRIL